MGYLAQLRIDEWPTGNELRVPSDLSYAFTNEVKWEYEKQSFFKEGNEMGCEGEGWG